MIRNFSLSLSRFVFLFLFSFTYYQFQFKWNILIYIIVNAGADPGGAHPAPPPPLKLENILFFGVKSWFFTRNTPKIFAPPSARCIFFKCAPPNLKSWIRPCMGTAKVIFVGEQWGATRSHVTGTDVTGNRVTGRFLNRLCIYNLACSGAVYD